MLACLHHLLHQDQSGVGFPNSSFCQDGKGLCHGLYWDREVGRDVQGIHSTSIVRQRCDPGISPFSVTHHLLFLSVLFEAVETAPPRRLARHVLGQSVLVAQTDICRLVALSIPSFARCFLLPDQHTAALWFGAVSSGCREIPQGDLSEHESFGTENRRSLELDAMGPGHTSRDKHIA